MNSVISSTCCSHELQAPVWVKTAQALLHKAEKALCQGCKAIRVQRQRRELAKLSVEQLKDVGISQEAAKFEAGRPFWDLPK